MIYADSPQAKGRIERDFQTLQDRLINELKLHNITTITSANKYLKEEYIPKWNKMFSRQAKENTTAYRAIASDIDLRDILCIKDKRKVYSDNTISYKRKRYQILPDTNRNSYAKAEVDIYEHLDGEISILYKGRKLRYTEIKMSDSGEEEEYSLEELFFEG